MAARKDHYRTRLVSVVVPAAGAVELLRDLNADDVVMVEVYRGGRGCGSVWVWLRS